MDILTNHMGYSAKGTKKAVLQCTQGEQPAGFAVVDAKGSTVYEGKLTHVGPVANWKTGDYYTADFSDLATEGTYRVLAEGRLSEPFEISKSFLTMRMLSAVGYYFKAQRASGEWAEADKHLNFMGPREGTVDLHGGWYDATGDYGVHLTHQSHTSYHNPQQAGFSAYAFFKIHEMLSQNGQEEYSMVKRRMLDEAFFGADFIMRRRAPSGSFFRSVVRRDALAPAEDARSVRFEYHKSSDQFSEKAPTAETETIRDEDYEASFRSGGGMAIATLAIAARNYYPSAEYSQAAYITSAKAAWRYLLDNNERYTNDGKWNLLDEYCALMAATELYRTTGEYGYLRDARTMAERIYARTVPQGEGMLRLEVDQGLPFYHASDEGMPIVALLQYAEIEPKEELRARAVRYCEEIMRWKLALTDAQPNPFGYPVLESLEQGEMRVRFFFPHTSTAAPWWQGDNARIASIASAAAMVSRATKDERLADRCRKMAEDPIDWIMGLNPYDSCMIEGYGRNNIQYFFGYRHDFLNCPGGIVNGITSGIEDEDGIEFVMNPRDGIYDNWRWAEQWLPHATWYMYALALRGE